MNPMQMEKALKDFFEKLFNKPYQEFTPEEWKEVKEYHIEIMNSPEGDYYRITKDKRPLHYYCSDDSDLVGREIE